MVETKKWFDEPEFEIVKLSAADVITTSDTDDDMDWGLGEF